MPEDKARARRHRSFDQLAWFFHHADTALIYDNSDNSGAAPSKVADKEGDRAWIGPDLLDELRQRLLEPR